MKKIITVAIIFLTLLVLGFLLLMTPNSPKAQVQTTQNSYVALGDSVAAGVGLKNDSDSSACNRTQQSYSHVIANSKHLNVKNFACSGATLDAGVLGPQTVNQLILPPQIDELIKLPRPDIVTLTVGANDIDWTKILAKCYAGNCGTAEDSAAISNKLQTVNQHVRTTLDKIKSRYTQQPPQVIVTGYYQVFPLGGANCPDLTGISSRGISWGREVQTSLSETIKSAVKDYPFAVFAPIDFSGHELCTPDSWIQGIRDKQPFHPTETGQSSIAREIISVSSSLK